MKERKAESRLREQNNQVKKERKKMKHIEEWKTLKTEEV